MAADNHASFTRIGLAVALGVAAIIGALVYLGGLGEEKDVVWAETYSVTPVSGLSVGSTVNFRGVKIGEVRRLSFIGGDYRDASEADSQKIRIVMAFNRSAVQLDEEESGEKLLKRMIAKGLHATVTASGITGLSRIELNYPRTAIADEAMSWKSEYVTIPPAASLLENFSSAATRVMNEINKMDLTAAWSNVAAIASSAADLTRNVNALVECQRTGINEIMENVASAAAAIRDLTQKLNENPSLLLRSADQEELPETKRGE